MSPTPVKILLSRSVHVSRSVLFPALRLFGPSLPWRLSAVDFFSFPAHRRAVSHGKYVLRTRRRLAHAVVHISTWQNK